jgi:hypothetical protein
LGGAADRAERLAVNLAGVGSEGGAHDGARLTLDVRFVLPPDDGGHAARHFDFAV